MALLPKQIINKEKSYQDGYNLLPLPYHPFNHCLCYLTSCSCPVTIVIWGEGGEHVMFLSLVGVSWFAYHQTHAVSVN